MRAAERVESALGIAQDIPRASRFCLFSVMVGRYDCQSLRRKIVTPIQRSRIIDAVGVMREGSASKRLDAVSWPRNGWTRRVSSESMCATLVSEPRSHGLRMRASVPQFRLPSLSQVPLGTFSRSTGQLPTFTSRARATLIFASTLRTGTDSPSADGRREHPQVKGSSESFRRLLTDQVTSYDANNPSYPSLPRTNVG